MHSRAKTWCIAGNGVVFEVVNLKGFINMTFPTLKMGGFVPRFRGTSSTFSRTALSFGRRRMAE
jgi:hypothetical protein